MPTSIVIAIAASAASSLAMTVMADLVLGAVISGFTATIIAGAVGSVVSADLPSALL